MSTATGAVTTATVTRPGTGGALSDALRYEWTRLRTLRSTYWLTGLLLLFSAVLGLVALAMDEVTATDYAQLFSGGDGGPAVLLTSILMGLIGVFATGHEYRYDTIRPTLTAVPRRSVLLTAKVTVVVCWVVVVTAVSLLLRYLVALAILGDQLWSLGMFPSPVGRVLLGVVGYVVVFTLVGFAVAALFRNIPAAIVLLVVTPAMVEPIIRVLLALDVFEPIRSLGKLLPFGAGTQAFATGDNGDDQFPLPGHAAGAVIFFGFMAILLAVAWTLFERRDA